MERDLVRCCFSGSLGAGRERGAEHPVVRRRLTAAVTRASSFELVRGLGLCRAMAQDDPAHDEDARRRLWTNWHRIGTLCRHCGGKPHDLEHEGRFGHDEFCETRPHEAELPGGYELDDDVERIDLDAVDRYLAEEPHRARASARVVEDLVVEPRASSASITASGSRLRTDLLGRAHALVSRRRLRARRAPRQGSGGGARSRGGRGQPACTSAWLLHTRDAQRTVRALRFGPPCERLWSATRLTAVRASPRSRSPRRRRRLRSSRSSCSRCPISTATETTLVASRGDHVLQPRRRARSARPRPVRAPPRPRPDGIVGVALFAGGSAGCAAAWSLTRSSPSAASRGSAARCCSPRPFAPSRRSADRPAGALRLDDGRDDRRSGGRRWRVLTQLFDWRAIFAVQVPLALVALAAMVDDPRPRPASDPE